MIMARRVIVDIPSIGTIPSMDNELTALVIGASFNAFLDNDRDSFYNEMISKYYEANNDITMTSVEETVFMKQCDAVFHTVLNDVGMAFMTLMDKREMANYRVVDSRRVDSSSVAITLTDVPTD